MKCEDCDQIFHIEEINWDRSEYGIGYRTDEPKKSQPDCRNCNGRIVSTIVNFGEIIPPPLLELSRHFSLEADLFVVLGSSLTVNPAASYPRQAKKNGAKLVIINLGKTKLDKICDLKIVGDVSLILPEVVKQLQH